MKASSQAKVMMNVRVIVGKPDENGRIQPRVDKKFKNTATRLMTESICNYLAGAESTYKRGKGRPNYMGIGTMGITKQPTPDNAKAEVEFAFEDTSYVSGTTTRPWFQSTSLALTDVCGAKNPDADGISLHFWDPTVGWNKNGFTGETSEDPIFQGELCTSRIPNHDPVLGEVDDWDTIERIPILRADVISDCPADWDFGVDGYASQVIFYGYASVEWVHNLLNPSKLTLDEDGNVTGTERVGWQLNVMAISEFGLYEKNNIDPHGLETMMAGFRVPTEDDIVYVTDGEVILIEWRVSVRALMPNEGVGIKTEPKPTGISVAAEVVAELPGGGHEVQMHGVVRGDAGVRQDITWSINNPDDLSSGTTITDTGLLTVASDEKSDVVYVTGASVVDPFILSKCAILTGLIKNLITGISLTTESITDSEIQFSATVLGKGTFSQRVRWSLSGAQGAGTKINTTSGKLTLDPEETADSMVVTATSTENTEIKSIAAVVRIDLTAGSYTVSDFSILTD